MSLIDLTPEYNLLEDYEQNDLVISVIDDLKLFFQSSKCSCRKTSEDLQNCFEKIGFKNFFERYFEFRSLNKKEKDLSIKTRDGSVPLRNRSGAVLGAEPIGADGAVPKPLCWLIFL